MKKPNFSLPETDVELDILLHPAQAFEHPSEVLRDPDLTLNEKRAILASWASDACAVEAVPAMRCAPGCERPVQVDENSRRVALARQAGQRADEVDTGAWFGGATSRRSDPSARNTAVVPPAARRTSQSIRYTEDGVLNGATCQPKYQEADLC